MEHDNLVKELWEMLADLNARHEKERLAILTTISLRTGRTMKVLDAIDRSFSQNGPAPAGLRPGDLLSPGEQRNQLAVVTDAVLAQGSDEFTKDTIKQWLETRGRGTATDNTLRNLSSFLWRLQKDGAIETKEKGAGQRQSVYVLAKNEPTPEGTTL